MNVYIWTSGVLKNAYIGEYKGTIQTFDFQNDWALGWYNRNIGYWDCTYVSGQWWQLTSTGASKQWSVYPPSSIYHWMLKKVTIRGYKNGNAAFWLYSNNNNGSIEYWRDVTKLIVNSNTIANLTINWEITMELIFENNWNITCNLINNWNTYNYNLWAYVYIYQWYWDNKDIWLLLWLWGAANTVYIRKVEITTV